MINAVFDDVSKKQTLLCLSMYFIFVFADIFKPVIYADYLKYTFVLYICFICLYSKKDFYLALSELIILPADYCLLFTNEYETGVMFFIAAMIIFILRHTQKVWLRFLPFFIITIVSYVNKTYIPSVYIIYALCFYINFLIVLSLKNKGLIIGFSLFALCDAAVAFNYISPNRTICSVIWLLYGASQLMIISSSFKPKGFLFDTAQRYHGLS